MERNVFTASNNFTRPNDVTAYASGDLVANNTTAGSVVPLSFAFTLGAGGWLTVNRILMYKTGTTTANASFRLHLYTASPTVANGDNGALVSNQHAAYLGSIDVSTALAFSAAAGGWGAAAVNAGLSARVAASPTLYGLLEARAAYTPTAQEVITVTVEAEILHRG